MIPIADKFRLDGFDFRLVKRIGDVALFEKSKPHHSRPCFEVVIVQKRRETRFPNGRVTPAHESMPASEQWGTAGWSYSERDEAEARFRRLLESPQNATPIPATSPKQPSEGAESIPAGAPLRRTALGQVRQPAQSVPNSDAF